MRHLGDVTKIKGAEIEPVDVIRTIIAVYLPV